MSGELGELAAALKRTVCPTSRAATNSRTRGASAAAGAPTAMGELAGWEGEPDLVMDGGDVEVEGGAEDGEGSGEVVGPVTG